MAYKVISIAVLLFGSIAYLNSSSASRTTPAQTRQGFTIRYLTTAQYRGEQYLTEHSIRAVSVNGDFKESKTSYYLPDETVKSHTIIGNSQGVFGTTRTGDMLELVGGPVSVYEDYRSDDFLAAIPGYIRREYVLGYNCYVVRIGNDQAYREQFYSPVFGQTILKRVIKSDESIEIKEAVAIELGDPNPADLAAPQLPISLDLIKRKIELHKQENLNAQADRLQEVVKRFE